MLLVGINSQLSPAGLINSGHTRRSVPSRAWSAELATMTHRSGTEKFGSLCAACCSASPHYTRATSPVSFSPRWEGAGRSGTRARRGL